MKANQKRKNSRKGFLAVILLALVGAVGLGAYVQGGGAQLFPSSERISQQRGPDREKVLVPKPEVDDKAQLELGTKPTNVPKGESAYVHAVNEFLKAFEGQPISAEKVSLDGTVARVYLTGDGTSSFGSRDEATFLLGLQAALGQFPEIDSVELYSEGQKVDELGHIALEGPVPVIRPENWKYPTGHPKEPNPPGRS